VDVAQFLDSFLFRKNIEVIKARLPEALCPNATLPNQGAPGLAVFARPGNATHATVVHPVQSPDKAEISQAREI
jgi:hypothetical protein